MLKSNNRLHNKVLRNNVLVSKVNVPFRTLTFTMNISKSNFWLEIENKKARF